ncbi:biopolymer transporter ExbB [Frigidibacter sp. MR17.24]|uniref:biopolymer transporter ExbB n=1 Tax=Frigidibacter sp. MR17.24 TaxID=3127345 RepID=UPI003FA54262
MLVVCALVVAGAWLILAQVMSVFASNPWLNGTILFVFVLGVLTCFWQVYQLAKSVAWIDRFVSGREGAAAHPPTLMAPLAGLLRGRARSSQIAASSARTILESVEDRIEEGRDITRYLANLLIFLGLLGTFYGLATTVPAVVQTIRDLAPQGDENPMAVFDRLMHGLESQLGGMGTAFSSSLLGLAGSLVVGLLELFASHGQNRFYRELEEWLTTISRLSFASGEGGDAGSLAQVVDYMAEQMGALQELVARNAEAGVAVDHRLSQLSDSVERLTRTLEAGTASDQHLVRIAAGQERIAELLERGATEDGPYGEAETRMRLRSIDVQLLRLLEEVAAGRQEAVGELRGDLAALTRAVRGLTTHEALTGRRG